MEYQISLNYKYDSNDSNQGFEIKNKKSVPSEKMLEKQKRNKRKSKVYKPNFNDYLRKGSDDSNEMENETTQPNCYLPNTLYNESTIVNGLEQRGIFFENFDLTTVGLDSLSMVDENVRDKENITPHHLLNFIRGLDEDPIMGTNRKTSYSQRFKDSNVGCNSSKRFKESKQEPNSVKRI